MFAARNRKGYAPLTARLEAMHGLAKRKMATRHCAFKALRKYGIENTENCRWQERRDSNSQPPVLETGALAN